jgi:hypothetical protein
MGPFFWLRMDALDLVAASMYDTKGAFVKSSYT